MSSCSGETMEAFHVMCGGGTAFHASPCNEAAFTLQIGYGGFFVLKVFCFKFTNTSKEFP